METTTLQRTDIEPGRIVDFDINDPMPDGGTFHEVWYSLINDTPHKLLWTKRNGGHWIVTDGGLLEDFFLRPDALSNRILFVPRETAEHHKMIPTTLDPPEHTPYRALLNRALSPRTVRRIQGSIDGVSRELIDSFVADGQCDFVAQYSSQFPIRIFLALVGLPASDAAQLKRWCDAIVRPDPELSFQDATDRLNHYMEPVVRQRMESPGEDLLSELLAGEIDGTPMSAERALQLASQILVAGLDTVVNLLGFIWFYLAENAEIQKQIAQTPNRATLVEEIIRRFPQVSIARVALQDIEADGVTIRTDEVVAMPTMAHGLDAKANACPMQLDFDRKSRSHSTFGDGPHRCPGAHLARTEVLSTLNTWFERIPQFEYAGDVPPPMQGGIVGTMDSLPLRWKT